MHQQCGQLSIASMATYRILTVSALFPPDVIGGAEASAAKLAQFWVSRGFEPGVITSARSPSEELDGELVNGIRVWRIYMPRPYPTFEFSNASQWQKPLWHLQDQFDPRNVGIMRKVLDAFRPDFVNVHMIQGIGYNALREIARRNIPTVYVLHDLGLACVRQSMFKQNADCPGHCLQCRFSTRYKQGLLRRFSRLGFASPSRANMDQLARFVPIADRPNAVILDPNRYPAATQTRTESDTTRILFVGRLHASKGITMLLRIAESLSSRYRFSMTIAGSGPLEAELVQQYGNKPWCSFKGFISQSQMSDIMVNSDVLCVPSTWRENSPGVVIHALTLGLPVLGSNKGGVPELIEHERTGLLVEAGNEVAWTRALERVLNSPGELNAWRDNALHGAARFDQDVLANQFLNFMLSVAAGR
jgi:glycosyltransferase involved in cell wall biosynthesis